MNVRAPRLLTALAASTLLALAATGAQARDMVAISKDGVNMRTGAGTQHAVSWELSKGYPLQVTGRRGDWLRVKDFENDTGWVHRPLTNKQAHHIVKSNVANIRSGPSTNTRVLGRAERGEVLRTLEKRPQWVKVQQDGGVSGWVSRPLLWGW
ncbi:MAG: SH3 domain-containing protein [Burkholderiales bacterium]|nr:SH3 domain-containing protein [Burkholderiales bacterium]